MLRESLSASGASFALPELHGGVSGALCGAAIGVAAGSLWAGAIAGVIGAVIGTLGGRSARARLAAGFGKDRPAAIIEDVVAIGGAALILLAIPG